MYRLDTYCGTALLRTMYTKKHLLYSVCLCSLIFLICFNFRSVVNVVSGKIIFTTRLCRELIGKGRQTDRQTDRQTEGGGREIETNIQTEKDKQTDRQTDRQSSEDGITIALIGSFET